MSGTVKQRLQALGNQIAPPPPSDTTANPPDSTEGLPRIQKVAGASAAPRLRGKVAIVTGANSSLGIGRASAHQFAENGARAVYICDFDDAHLEAHRREIAALYPDVDVHVRRFDAADEASVKAVVDHAVQTYGRLDVFFANAGVVGKYALFSDFDKDEFMKVLDTNVASVFLAAKYAAPAMQKTSASKPTPSGSIIGTASVAGLRSNAGTTPYAASKAAVVSLAQTVAYQLAGTGVRVNAVCPGIIETGMTAPTFEAARARGTEKKIGQLNPLKRGGRADEVARVALFLASDEASYVNGQAWAVDGGLSAGHPYVLGKLA
ncbi:NAD(P)-binding protein [Hypoxylon sp. FL1284]|nr:NAD(P)-binding protein [Hypoxylon sp. FL1284]